MACVRVTPDRFANGTQCSDAANAHDKQKVIWSAAQFADSFQPLGFCDDAGTCRNYFRKLCSEAFSTAAPKHEGDAYQPENRCYQIGEHRLAPAAEITGDRAKPASGRTCSMPSQTLIGSVSILSPSGPRTRTLVAVRDNTTILKRQSWSVCKRLA